MGWLPNFFIVGAAKAGTTSLYYYLSQHPEIYMSPIKEPNYFAKDIDPKLFREDYKKLTLINTKKYIQQPKLKKIPIAFIRDFEEYLQLFRHVKNEKAIGEASNSYLYSKEAPIEIKKELPNAKIIMILRNPIERAYSHYIMNLKMGLTTEKSFLKEVVSDYNRSNKGWGISHLYIELGLYYGQVKRYFDVFPEENIKIILYDDFRKNTREVIKEVFKFLGVKDDVYIDVDKKYNVGTIPRHVLLNKLFRDIYINIKSLVPYKFLNPVKTFYSKIFYKKYEKEISMEERRILLEYFRDDIDKLSNLINKDLSVWLETED